MKNLQISYLTLRKIIGIVALVIPILLVAAGMFGGVTETQPSISQYYWTTAGDLLTGSLFVFGLFLLAYKGYDKTDRVLTLIAGIAILLVAFFPCEGTTEADYIFMFLSPTATGIIHYASAVVTFSAMGLMSILQFTRSGGELTDKKKKRNRIYRTCGYGIFASILIMALIRLIPGAFEATNPAMLFYWVESSVLWFFGTSWLVKGEAVLKD